MDDVQILDYQIGETAIKDMSAITFLQYIARKLNQTPSFSAAAVELRLAVSNPPAARQMASEEKVRLCRKLMSLGVEL